MENTPLVAYLQNRIKSLPAYQNTTLETVSDYHEVIREYQAKELDFAEYKKYLLIHPEKGRFFHACPGSDGVLCCRYYVLDFGMNCVFDCDYCYLQTYLKNPLPTLAGNAGELFNDLKTKVLSYPDLHWRIGTGEYTDSLALDHITGLSGMLIDLFEKLPNATLELKTKSTQIEHLLQRQGAKADVVVSWSLNPAHVIQETEHGCPGLNERLEAAAQIANAGFHVAFHFDPIILPPFEEESKNTLQDYLAVLDELFQRVDEKSIRWISLGSFRYTPGLREVLRARRPGENLTRAEMVRCHDGKYRYPGYERAPLYRAMMEHIRRKSPGMMVYLCMETKPVWQSAAGYSPAGPGTLDRAFENRRRLLKGIPALEK